LPRFRAITYRTANIAVDNKESPKMKKLILLSYIALFSINAFAQKTPTFAKYRVAAERKTAKQINFKSHPMAKTFRTNLKNIFANGEVDFAGKYMAARWGCGSGCLTIALIDAKTGNVFFPKILRDIETGYFENENLEKVEYRQDSRLFIIRGFPGTASPTDDTSNRKQGFWYYEWTGKDFRLLKFIEKSRPKN
jgi:hypothetical protein